MNSTWTILRKDLYRVRWYLAAGLLLVVLQMAMGFRVLLSDDSGTWGMRRLLDTLNMASGAVAFLTVAIIMVDDSVVSTRAFWLTRPIGRGRLALAKALVVAIVIFAPTLTWIPWWRFCALNFEQLAWGAFDVTLWPIVGGVTGWAMAAVTDGMARLATWTLVLIAAWITGPLLWGGGNIGLVSGRAQEAKALVQVSALLVTSLAVVLAQVAFGRWRASVAVFAIGMLAVGFVGAHWDIPFGSWLEERALRDVELARAIDVKYVHTRREDFGQQSYPNRTRLVTALKVDNLRRGTKLSMHVASEEFVFPGGKRFQTTGNVVSPPIGASLWTAFGAQFLERDAATQEWFNSRVPIAYSVPPPEGDIQLTHLLSHPTVDRLVRDQAGMAVQLRCTLLEPRVLLERPVAAGGWTAADGFGYRVVSSTRYSSRRRGSQVLHHGVDVAVAYTYPSSRRDRLLPHWQKRNGNGWFLFKHAKGEVLLHMETFAGESTVTIAGVAVGRRTCSVAVENVRRGESWLPRFELTAADLVMAVGMEREVARFTRDVVVDRMNVIE